MKVQSYMFNPKTLKYVLDKFDENSINELEEKRKIISKWIKFLDSGKLELSNETQIDLSFLEDFFTKILDYTWVVTSEDEWNIVPKQKMKTTTNRSDGAIGFFTKQEEDIRVVIELKGATISLDEKQHRENKYTPVEQAFDYAHKAGKKCNWVIVSNFKEMRLYNYQTSNEYERFFLNDLENVEVFKKFFFLLSKDNLISKNKSSKIEKMYLNNTKKQEEISKDFYSKYKATRSHLFEHLKQNNPEKDELLILEKTQKLLDRFIFVCFCEDKDLLPDRIFRKTLTEAKKSILKMENKYWTFVKGLFDSINEGNEGNDINKFNGGLFAPDNELDSLVIHDTILEELVKIADYDFDTDLNVNILGHIFEQSISDLEEMKAEINGEKVSKKEGKRKKDGIYYTPEFITRYIVENTIWAWLEQKRKGLGFYGLPTLIKKDYDSVKTVKSKAKPMRYNKNIEMHLTFWSKYKTILENVKVLDPACGSGAFLNQAFDFLYKENLKANEEIAKLKKGLRTIYDWEKILSNNLFGVDLNPESVEITKLSLWLKTADREKELTMLDDNILCGNSLIDSDFRDFLDDDYFNLTADEIDTLVKRENPFDWKTAFLKIMENGGFDIIIGNPPWGAKFTPQAKKYLKKKYSYATVGKIDSYKYFYERCFFHLMPNPKSMISFITPNTFLYNIQSKNIRLAIIDNFRILEGNELRKNIFEDAPDVVPAILILSKFDGENQNYTFESKVAFHNKKVIDIATNPWMLEQNLPISILREDNEKKINLRFDLRFTSIKKKMANHPPLDKFFFGKQGTKPYGSKELKENEIELLKKNVKEPNWEPAINGRNLGRYKIDFEDDYILNSEKIHSRLPQEVLNNEKLYFQRMRKISLFPRIVAAYDDNKYHGLYTCSVLYPKPGTSISLKYLLCLLNSLLLNVWYKYYDTDVEIKLESVRKIPIAEIQEAVQQSFGYLADKMMALNEEKTRLIKEYEVWLSLKYNIGLNSRALSNFFNITEKKFFNELKKNYPAEFEQLPPPAVYELKINFEDYSEKVNAIEGQLLPIENQIDELVYSIYNLSDQEINFIKSHDSFFSR